MVKLWDLRKATLPTSRINPAVEAACLGCSPSQTIGKRQHGVTCLTLSPEGMSMLPISTGMQSQQLADISRITIHINSALYRNPLSRTLAAIDHTMVLSCVYVSITPFAFQLQHGTSLGSLH